MFNITLKSEYSFGQCYGFLKDLHDNYSKDGVIGIADNNTFSFFKLKTMCNKSGVKPIFGYRVNVVKDATLKIKPRGQFGIEYVIIAKNVIGLREIYKLTKINSANFYYRGNISVSDINKLSKNVIVISTNPISKRLDYIGINFMTTNKAKAYNFPKVYVENNYYCEQKDEGVYQLYAERNSENKTFPQYIMCENEVRKNFGTECISNLKVIVDQVEVFDLPKANNVKYKGSNDIVDDCKKGAKKLGIDLLSEPYKSRFKKEINLIHDKDYTDYLMVVAEIIKKAGEICFLGPGRGSSGGSLVCYLLGITKFDPIPYGLIFERFIDINRFDPPDVDSDIPDNARQRVVKQIEKRYGIDNVKTISNITKLKPKSAIGIFAKGMDIPPFDTEEVKDVIIDRAAGDARASFCLEDTLNDTEVGREFLKKYPEMLNVKYIENHAKTKGKHAAGVIVCNENLTEYCGVDERDQTVYLDKKDAESLNLLKIDVLGLRTLAVLETCAKLVGFDYNDYYSMGLDDPKAYKVFKDRRMTGIFQFDGDAMASINDSIPMENFNDIVACAALGRPGSLSSGGTSRFIQLRNGDRKPVYYSGLHKKITEETHGIVIFQETFMQLCREIANMSWTDISMLRKAASKSMGDEYFNNYKINFVKGAIETSGYSEEEATKVWLDISSMGCLSGETLLQNPFPNQNQPQKFLTIKQLYESDGYSSVSRRENCEFKASKNRSVKDCLKQNIYMVEKDGKIRPNRIIKVYKSGEKETFLLTAIKEDGKKISIRATKDHKFMVSGMSYKKLSELKEGDNVVCIGTRRNGKGKFYKGTGSGAHNKRTWKTYEWDTIQRDIMNVASKCNVCNIQDAVEVHHINGNHLDNSIGNHIAICRSCHRKAHILLEGENLCVPHKIGKSQQFAKIISINERKIEMTYDISMPEPNNFIANEFAVHNSYAFNKSHSVAYGLISYWCAWAKGNYPLEFIAANLNNAKDDESSLKILREFYINDGLEYSPVDTQKSGLYWKIVDGSLVGGLTNLKGVGVSKARDIIKIRKGEKKLTPAMAHKIQFPETPFDILYKITHNYGNIYDNPLSYGLNKITTVNRIEEGMGEISVIGTMITCDDVDINDVQSVAKRAGEIISGPHMKVHMRLQDDSGVVMCILGRFRYEEMSQTLLRAKVGKTDFAIVGKVLSGAKIIMIEKIANLTVQIDKNNDKEDRDNKNYRNRINKIFGYN